jgi:hypothetical protein
MHPPYTSFCVGIDSKVQIWSLPLPFQVPMWSKLNIKASFNLHELSAFACRTYRSRSTAYAR